jgi:anti-sigma regulatory factor (Ser/Thr protein kinase)
MTGPVRHVFSGRQDQVACARQFVRSTVEPCPVLDEAVLLTSELCANALQHTASGNGGSFEVTVFLSDHSLRIEVRDEGATTIPAVRAVDDLDDDLAERGRGLELVALIASRWGQCGDEYGRSVFFELRWDKP